MGDDRVKYIFNLNSRVKVKLTDHGKDIYYHQYDDIKSIEPRYPKEDDSGYFEDQMWSIMQTFGKYIGVCKKPVFKDIQILIDSNDLTEIVTNA